MNKQQHTLVELYLTQLVQLAGTFTYKATGALKYAENQAKYTHFRDEMRAVLSKIVDVHGALVDIDIQMIRDSIVKENE